MRSRAEAGPNKGITFVLMLVTAIVFGFFGAMLGLLVGYVVLSAFFGLDHLDPLGTDVTEEAILFAMVGLGAVGSEVVGAFLVYRWRMPSKERLAIEADYDDGVISEQTNPTDAGR